MGISSSRKLTGAAIIVMTATVFSRISGFLREALITNKLGTDKIGDAYNAAFLLPDLMFQLLLGGALAAALIPILSGYIEKNEEEEGWKVLGTFINITFIAIFIFCTMGIFFAPKIVPLIDKKFYLKDLETQILAVKLTRILFPSVAFLMLAGICNGVLNSYQKFASAAYGPVLYNLGGVLSLFLLGSESAQGAERVAYGVLVSAVIYFIFQFTVTYSKLKYFRFKIYLKHPGFIRMFKLAIPSLISSSITQINLIVSSSFTTYAAAGSLTLFNTANRTWQLPLGIFAQSMGVALLPTMSARLAVGDLDDYKNILNKGLKTVLFLAMPSAVAFIVLGESIVRSLFKFALFTEEDVHVTGYILMFFSLALVAQSAQAILGRAFFAANDTKTPLLIGLSTLVVNYAFSFLLYEPMGVAGMALANSISSVIYSILLIVILNRKMGGLYLKKLITFMVKVTASALIMGIVLYPVNMILPVDINSKISQVINLGIEVAVGVAIYFGVTMLLRLEEAVATCNGILNRLKRLATR